MASPSPRKSSKKTIPSKNPQGSSHAASSQEDHEAELTLLWVLLDKCRSLPLPEVYQTIDQSLGQHPKAQLPLRNMILVLLSVEAATRGDRDRALKLIQDMKDPVSRAEMLYGVAAALQEHSPYDDKVTQEAYRLRGEGRQVIQGITDPSTQIEALHSISSLLALENRPEAHEEALLLVREIRPELESFMIEELRQHKAG